MSYVYIAMTILFTVYGQVVLKWQVTLAGPMPDQGGDRITFLLGMLLKPWVLSGFAAAFVASIAWMAAISKFDLSYAYPFMSLNFVLVLALSGFLFHEPLTTPKLIGLCLIILGIVIGSQGERGL